MALEPNARVIYKEEITPSLMILRVQPLQGGVPDFLPGQYTTIGLQEKASRSPLADKGESSPANPDRWIRRAYSIASAPQSKEYIEFYVTLVNSGELTPRLFALKEGDQLWMSNKIVGHFTIEDIPKDHHIVFVATGTGLAPYISMMRSRFTCGVERKFAILHGVRHSWDLGYREELLKAASECPNFAYLATIDHPHEEKNPWQGYTGFVQDLWLNGHLEKEWKFAPNPKNTHFLLCGNPLMIEDTVKALKERGFAEHAKDAPGQIHVEKYW